MRKSLLVLTTILVITLAFAGCNQSSTSESSSELPINSSSSQIEEITDEKAKQLFESATNDISELAYEEPMGVVNRILGDDIKTTDIEIIVGETPYYETTGKFKDLEDYYAKTFSGEALDWVMSTKFIDTNGVLYCSAVGGATGWEIENLKVTQLEKNENSYTYKAEFVEFEEPATSEFVVEKSDAGYRIAKIDYVPGLLK